MTDTTNPDEKLLTELRALVAREGMVDAASLQPGAKLADLNIISADFIMILMAIEEEYGAYISVDGELTEIETVGDLMNAAVAKIKEHRADMSE